MDISEITFGARLGAGAYGEVYEGQWRRSKVALLDPGSQIPDRRSRIPDRTEGRDSLSLSQVAIKRLLCGQVEDKSIKQVSSSNHVLITIVIA